MPNFTKDEMFEEMRAMLAADAKRISVVRNDEAAAVYLGVPATGFDPDDIDPALIDLSRFRITGCMSQCYDYAFCPTELHDEGWVLELRVDGWLFLLSAYADGGKIPESYGASPYTSSLTFHCHTVMRTVEARAKLDFSDDDLTIQELAVLAEMSEGSVRNAARAAGEARLQTASDGKRTYISHEEALRWLNGRRGYVPSPKHRAVSPELVRAAQSTPELGTLLMRLREHQNRSQNDLAADLGWSIEKLSAWENGTYELSLEDSKALAKALDIDPVMFVTKAVELGLRRDGGA